MAADEPPLVKKWEYQPLAKVLVLLETEKLYKA
jgi:hypothetical protein